MSFWVWVQLEVRVKGLGEPGNQGSNLVDSPPLGSLRKLLIYPA